MAAKVQAISNSPFDTSIVVDTDVWPWSRERNFKTSVRNVASNHAIAGVIDPWHSRTSGAGPRRSASNDSHFRTIKDYILDVSSQPIYHLFDASQ